jgi:hypothetical protein
MFRQIRNWWIKAWGGHVCEEFTRWESYEAAFSVTTALMKGSGILIKRWQERTCTQCGKLELRPLPDDHPTRRGGVGATRSHTQRAPHDDPG